MDTWMHAGLRHRFAVFLTCIRADIGEMRGEAGGRIIRGVTGGTDLTKCCRIGERDAPGSAEFEERESESGC